MKAQDEMRIMAREFVRALAPDDPFDPYGDHKRAQDGVWFIELADTEPTLYRLARGSGPNGGIDHPLSSVALSSRGLADALYYARRALGLKAHYAAGGA